MTQRPIIFGAPMVQAIMGGRKTQTRRVIKPQPDCFPRGPHDPFRWRQGRSLADRIKNPYGGSGDHLYVRENFRLPDQCDTVKPSEISMPARILYEADITEATPVRMEAWGKLRPAIHLPKRAARIILTIRDVRVERLQDISEADAMAEGVVLKVGASDEPALRGRLGYDDTFSVPGLEIGNHFTARSAFFALWRHINGGASLQANPWLWVVDFGGDDV